MMITDWHDEAILSLLIIKEVTRFYHVMKGLLHVAC